MLLRKNNKSTACFAALLLCVLFAHNAAAAENVTEENKALNIRYSCFPRKDVRAVDYRVYLLEQQAKKAAESPKQQEVFKDAQIKQEFNSYKQRQLEAIKSDNETLSNLHKAIQTLSIEEELEHMAPRQNLEKPEGR
ncbi:MAG: hypothetical protein FWF23_00405 [Alphaproteobacteria bacterium]|nr:hypothetical protein [Alphaproteobacteria bacterium]MCL2505678.1 hypothetical protein [Alphaproteobacteria bacterium]